jgi:hypothetical protein
MLRLLRQTVLAQLFLLVAGCAQLPDYARPHVRMIDPQIAASEQGFSYKRLTMDDFRALGPPEHLTPHADTINAYSCIQIRPARNSKFKVIPQYYNGEIFYFGSIEYIVFEAVMIPYCSWWNPRVPKEKIPYVLEHEQIHFALMELAARKLTREAREVAKTFLVIHEKYEEARGGISTKVRKLARTAMDEALEEHTEFDRDTSLFFDPKKQRQWMQKVEKQLGITAPE